MLSSSLSDATALSANLANEYVADVVEALNGMEPGLATAVLAAMPIERAAHILGQPGFDQPQRLVERLPIGRAAAILSAMLADRRADIVRRLSEPLRAQLCAELEEPLRRSLLELLAYPHGTAGAIMTTG